MSEQSPQEGVTRGEGEEAKGAPPKEQDRRGEKRNPGKEEPAEGGGEPPGKPPGDGDEKEKKSESATTKNLDYAPVLLQARSRTTKVSGRLQKRRGTNLLHPDHQIRFYNPPGSMSHGIRHGAHHHLKGKTVWACGLPPVPGDKTREGYVPLLFKEAGNSRSGQRWSWTVTKERSPARR